MYILVRRINISKIDNSTVHYKAIMSSQLDKKFNFIEEKINFMVDNEELDLVNYLTTINL